MHHLYHPGYQKGVEEVVACHVETEATYRPGDTSSLRPSQFKVHEIFVGTIFDTRNKRFYEDLMLLSFHHLKLEKVINY
jgi:hypothetical protein